MPDSAWQQIQDAFSDFLSRPSPHPPYIGAVAAGAGDGLAAGRAFAPEQSYFSVRMVEMRLAEGGKYFINYLPLGVCVAEYTYGAERRRVPLVLSNETVKQMLGDAGGPVGQAYLTNMPVVRRAPVKQDNLALFVGLFRMPYNDVARTVLQLAADVSEELGGAALGAGTKVAAKLYDRVADIFALSTVQPRFAFLDGMALTKSGYILVSGPLPDNVDKDQFVVENGRLRIKGPQSRMPDGFDYCLLAIEHHDSLFAQSQGAPSGAMLGALAGLPFHARWRDVSSLLAVRKGKEAEDALLALRAAVVLSPDLTEGDRLVAIGGYDIAFAQFQRALSPAADARVAVSRAGSSGSPVAAWKTEASVRKQRGEVVTASALNTIADQFQRSASAASARGGEASDDILAEAWTTLRRPMEIAHAQGLRASSLAKALSISLGR
jgi:hypothetical protein